MRHEDRLEDRVKRRLDTSDHDEDRLEDRVERRLDMSDHILPSRWSYAARLGLAVAILAAGGAISAYWLMRRPKAKRKPLRTEARLVEVSQVRADTHQVVVRALGTVVPARHIMLASRVSGEIVEVSPKFVPGGQVRAGERILRIEPEDYQLVVQRRTGELTQARAKLKLEMGQQAIARREYRLLRQEVREEDKELLLRGPQLASAQAAVSAAEAALEQARLDLRRTDIRAPFNAVIQNRSVDVGSQVSPGAALASLVGTDEYWVQASVPADELRWIDIPSRQDGSVRVFHKAAWGAGVSRVGTVARLMSELEPQGRMARLLIAVKDPLGLAASPAQRPPLILGSYVRVEIEGRHIENVVRVARTALRDGVRVWVIKPDSTLDIREVSIIWSGSDHVYVAQGLNDGDRLITSDLGTPVPGMALRTADSAKRGP